MTNKLIKGLIATAVLAALAGCNSDDDKVPTTCAEAGAACKTFTVLHTNDNHGRFWENKDGEYGLAAQKTLVDQIRAEVSKKGGQTLLLSGGDINTGVPESDLQDAIPDFTGTKLVTTQWRSVTMSLIIHYPLWTCNVVLLNSLC